MKRGSELSTVPTKSVPRKLRAHPVRDIFKKYIAKPIVLAAFVISVQVAGHDMASAKSVPNKPISSSITLQSDSLRLQKSVESVKPMPPAVQNFLQSALSGISTLYPTAVLSWASGCAQNEISPHIDVRLVDKKTFAQIEGLGESVKYERDFNLVYLRADLAVLKSGLNARQKDEFIFAVCDILSSYGGFQVHTPFSDIGVRSLIPYLMASHFISDPKNLYGDEEPHPLNGRQACALWFAQELGIENFVAAYMSGTDSALRKTLSDRFKDPRIYDMLIQLDSFPHVNYNPLKKILDLTGADLTPEIEPISELLGRKVQPISK